MQVKVKYIFGIRDRGGDNVEALELAPGTTVFQVMQRLGMASLEVHPALNGQSVPDSTVLKDGDELILIPGIQGGALEREACCHDSST